MEDVMRFLEEAGVDFDVLEHAHTERAADEAAALGIRRGEVAKTLEHARTIGAAIVVVLAAALLRGGIDGLTS